MKEEVPIRTICVTTVDVMFDKHLLSNDNDVFISCSSAYSHLLPVPRFIIVIFSRDLCVTP